jgi:anti-sigma B factor antagonist
MGPPESDALVEKVAALLKDGVIRIALDLKNVKWINSMGVSAILKSLGMVQKAGGFLHLAQLSDKVKSVFMISQLTRVLTIHESEEQAIAVMNEL